LSAAPELVDHVDQPLHHRSYAAEWKYKVRRSRAFALAANGSRDDALSELGRAWSIGRPGPADRAVDAGWIRVLSGDPAGALTALENGLRGPIPPDTYRLLSECVRCDPNLRGLAVRVALCAGSPAQRARGVVAALGSRPENALSLVTQETA
jgi:hypothetical protein